jgi:hypothetical protein
MIARAASTQSSFEMNGLRLTFISRAGRWSMGSGNPRAGRQHAEQIRTVASTSNMENCPPIGDEGLTALSMRDNGAVDEG